MKNQNPSFRFILSLLLALVAVFCVNRRQAVADAAGSDKIYYFNMSANGTEGSMMLVESDGHWGLVDTGHRNASYMRDYNTGDILYVSPDRGLSSQVYCRNGKDAAYYMINNLGVTHLDFIVGTHAHSDHIGGIPEIAATTFKDASGTTRYLIDSNTTYYYKEYQHISDVEDDLAHFSTNSWHNQAFASQATVAMQSRGANLVDVSKAQVIHGDPGNAYGDYVTFTIGNMSFRLYNVYEQTNTGDENVNSIVTVMTNGNYSVVNLADINTDNGAIDKTSQAIAKDFGSVDVVVAGHHGYAGSNTKTMFDSLQPSFVVVPNGQESFWLYADYDLAAAIPYAQSQYGTAFYNLSISPYAVVTDLSGQRVYVYTVNGKGDLTNAINKMIKSVNKTGWVSWMQTNGTLWSYLENGNSVKNAWRRINGKMYHFDSTGIMQTGWFTDGGGTRYLDSSGALVVGWDYLNGKWYYFEGSKGYRLANCWQRIDGKMYRFDKDGIMLTGWYSDGGGTRYLDGSGALTVGWKQIDGKWYFFEGSKGYRLTNCWQRIDGKMYYFDSDGSMHTGWHTDSGGTRYLDGNGVLTVGWKQIGGKWYYFEGSKGYRLQNKWQRIDGKMYYFDSDGSMHTGWHTDGGGTRYLDGNGVLTVGWKQIGGKWYYFEGSKGYRLQNKWQRIGSKMYYFDSDGSMHTGWHTDSGGTRYLDSSGALVTGWQKIGGVWYYFEGSKGYKQTLKGWYRLDGTMHYYDSDGTMHKGWLTDSGGTRYLNPGDGSLTVGWKKIDGKWYYFEGSKGYRLQSTWQRLDGKMFYFDADGSEKIGWYTDSGGTRYLDENIGLVTGWKKIGGKWYYFEGSKGYRLQSTWQRLDGKMFYFNSDGSEKIGWYTDSGGTRYLDENKGLLVGWQQISGKWYYFEGDKGYLQNPTGWQRLNGTMHYFDSNGDMQTGWFDDGVGVRYLGPGDGSLTVGWKKIDGKWYYFEGDKGYRLQSTWQRIEGKMFYFGADGVMQTGWFDDGAGVRYLIPDEGSLQGSLTVGWKQINGAWYYFESNKGYRLAGQWERIDGKMYYFNGDGVMQTGWLNADGKTRWLDSSGALTTGWQQIGGTWYYFDTNDGNMWRNATTPDGYYVNADGVWVQ